MTYYEAFKPLAEKLIKTKGKCSLGDDLDCSECLIQLEKGEYYICNVPDAYKFALKYMKENGNKQLELDF